MPTLHKHAVRISLSLAASPEAVPLDTKSGDAMCTGLASALNTDPSRFLLIEARPLDNSWTLVFDIEPPPTTKAQFALADRLADRSATALADALAASFISGGGGALLSACGPCQMLNLSYGVQRMSQTPDGSWTATRLQVTLPTSTPAHGGGTFNWMGWMRPLGFLAAAAALAVGLRFALRSSAQEQTYAKVHPAEAAEHDGMLGSRAVCNDGMEVHAPYVIVDRHKDTAGQAVQFF
jgi:hypothetical protein